VDKVKYIQGEVVVESDNLTVKIRPKTELLREKRYDEHFTTLRYNDWGVLPH
jgi:hypothetical protein